MTVPLLSIDQLEFAYSDLQVLWGIDIAVNEGEIVTLVGANGAGKSTTLKNVSRLVRGGARATLRSRSLREPFT